MAKKTEQIEKQNESKALTITEKNISEEVLARVAALEKSGGLQIPAHYSAPNALKSAWLYLQTVKDKDRKPALSVCTRTSIANAMLDMVIQGLNPQKKQCYFIVFGNELTLLRSYFGAVLVTKQLPGIKDVFANVVFEKDKINILIDSTTMLKRIEHETAFENIDISKIKGAYGVILRDGLPPFVEIMNKEQIQKAWEMGATKGKSPAHINFPDEMSKKTAINRTCKLLWNSSDDSVLLDSIKRTMDIDDLADTTYEEVVENEVGENANKIMLDVDVPPAEEKKTEPKTNGIDWENPIAVIAAIEQIKTTDEMNNFKKVNKQRLEMLRGDKNVMEALDKKENAVLRGF